MRRAALATSLLLLSSLGAGCGPRAEFEDLNGLWIRVDDGEYQGWELAREIDATGLVDVLPAFRRWEYDLDSNPREMARGRWNIFDNELVITASWSLIGDPEAEDLDLLLEENTTLVLEIDSFSPVELNLLYPGEEEPRSYVREENLPGNGPE